MDKLDRDRTLTFCWESLRNRARLGQTEAAHAEKVGEKAESFCNFFYRDSRMTVTPADKDLIEVTWHAGILHGTLSAGRRYEEVCWVSNVTVAELVASVTPDYRVAPHARMLELGSRLAESPDISKVLMLADTACQLEQFVTSLVRKPAETAPQFVAWLPEVTEILRVLQTLKNASVSMQEVWIWCRQAIKWLDGSVTEFKRVESLSRKLGERSSTISPQTTVFGEVPASPILRFRVPQLMCG